VSYVVSVRVVEVMSGTCVVAWAAVVMTVTVAVVCRIVVVRIVSIIIRAVPVVVIERGVPCGIVVRAVVDVPIERVIPAIVERIPAECPYCITEVQAAPQGVRVVPD
jgi:hypothetical protein